MWRFSPRQATDFSAPAGTSKPPPPATLADIDLGALASEFLALALDPYPRKPGVEFEAPAVDDADESPFDALAELAKKQP